VKNKYNHQILHGLEDLRPGREREAERPAERDRLQKFCRKRLVDSTEGVASTAGFKNLGAGHFQHQIRGSRNDAYKGQRKEGKQMTGIKKEGKTEEDPRKRKISVSEKEDRGERPAGTLSCRREAKRRANE